MHKSHLNINQLTERLNYSMTKKDVLWLANEYISAKHDIELLISQACFSDTSKAFRAAWVLENILAENPLALDYYTIKLIELLPNVKSESVKRHFTKLISHGISRVVKKKASKIYERNLWATDLEPLEEFCFKWFVEDDAKPAVKAHALEILFLLSTREKWIADELPQIIENQIKYGSPSLKAKGKSVLKRLEQQNR